MNGVPTRRQTRSVRVATATAAVAGLLAIAGCGTTGPGEATAGAAEAASAGGGVARPDRASAVDVRVGAGIRSVAPAEFESVVAAEPDRLLIDIRTDEEMAAGRLPGARQMDFSAPGFSSQLAGLDRDAPYALYCRSGNRSGQAVEMMRELGFTDVVEMAGGILAWEAAGLAVER